MNFIEKILNKTKNNIDKETINLNPSIEEINSFFNGKILEISNSKLNSTTYYSCMQIRCNAIAKLPIKLMKESESGSIKAKEHSIYKVLKKRPNKFMTPHDFIWATEFQRLEHGNSYWVMMFKKNKIDSLYLLDSSKVKIIIDNKGILSNEKNAIYYIYDDPKMGEIIYTSENIVHFKNFSMDGMQGTPIKRYISKVIANEQYATEVINEKYSSGLQDPIIVEYIGDLNDARQQKIKKKFADLGGAKNAGQVVPIPTDFKVSQLETKLVNSQFFELQGLTTRHIANAFGVKGFQLNDMEKSTYNNIEQQNKAFYSDTLQNVLTIYEQEMDYKLLSEDEREKYFFKINADSILRSDLKTRIACHKMATEGGFKTIAEVRAEEDWPYIEGTEKLIIGNGASIPFDDLGKQYTNGGESNE